MVVFNFPAALVVFLGLIGLWLFIHFVAWCFQEYHYRKYRHLEDRSLGE